MKLSNFELALKLNGTYDGVLPLPMAARAPGSSKSLKVHLFRTSAAVLYDVFTVPRPIGFFDLHDAEGRRLFNSVLQFEGMEG